ncbi:MAG: GNAT family N-acetyltransferase [Burkholderiaceae bacterium]|nr:GNAT family N-acetyltransferase [Burkholderiaceae bacterium]MDZ4143710.1 GNAT family N-acetyltransferase [Burkholderiales bacterium]
MKNTSNDYVIRVLSAPAEVSAADWNALLALQPQTNPFMRHEYLAALHDSQSAVPGTGWAPRFVTLWRDGALQAACALYLKAHSYGEYVFDWAWANAYAQHGLAYYPKAVVAPPFTPVPGARLLARDAVSRVALVRAVVAWCKAEELSSLHLLFCSDEDVEACTAAGLMLRHTVQFHWKNVAPTLPTACGSLPPGGAGLAWERPGAAAIVPPRSPTACGSLPPAGAELAWERPGAALAAPTLPAARGSLPPGGAHFTTFDDFLASLSQDKRKKIRQERRKVAEAGVSFRWARGRDITPQDWDFFYRCYERTYLEHGNAPYLTRDFFERMAQTLPQAWLLFVAERAGIPIASSLIAINDHMTGADGQFHSKFEEKVAYGRYWGALERVDCLHFEACYYQPLAWCIAHGFDRFEGGAQGEHKMARALLPVRTTSAHWLAHPAFADAVERFLEREGEGVQNYLEHLAERNPFRRNPQTA